jgi:preprotein translocase subunit Sec63
VLERSAQKRPSVARSDALLSRRVHSQVRPFDPFEILGVTHGATEKDIKRAYRQLSLKFHPDKVSTRLLDCRPSIAA